jgi:vanillate O-demethylase ferredoxin subunit
MTIPTLQVRVCRITLEAAGINSYELVDPNGRDLPPFTAGAHVDAHLPGGIVRQYSLCNPPSERHRYVVAVLNEIAGRGGSRAMHEQVRAGDLLTVSEPRNNFPLREEAKRHVLIAGGIGATPLLAMVHRLTAVGAAFDLHYCTRMADKTAFRGVLALVAGARVHYHHDGGDPSRGLDVAKLLWTHEMGTHLYCCGPAGLMAAVKAASAHWPAGSVHFEFFAPPPAAPAGQAGADAAFEVRLASSGESFIVPPDKSILQALREHGRDADSSCEAGTCGTCMTGYLEGEPDHRDFVLDDDQRRQNLMICVSRSKSAVLVLDL